MKQTEHIIWVEVKAYISRSPEYSIPKGMDKFSIPAIDRKKNIEAGYIKDIPELNFPQIHDLKIIMISNSNRKTTYDFGNHTIPLKAALNNDISFYAECSDNNFDFTFPVFFLSENLHSPNDFHIHNSEKEKIVHIYGTVTADAIYESFLLGASRVISNSFTLLANDLARQYKIKTEIDPKFFKTNL